MTDSVSGIILMQFPTNERTEEATRAIQKQKVSERGVAGFHFTFERPTRIVELERIEIWSLD